MEIPTEASAETNDGLWLSSNTSGYRGVRRCARNFAEAERPWVAELYRDGKIVFLGSFATAQEAAVNYAAARRSWKAEAAEASISIPRSCVFQNEGDSNWYARVHSDGFHHYVGSFQTEAEAKDAYLDAKRESLTREAQAGPSCQSRNVLSELRGVRLHLSPNSLTGYLGVYQFGRSRFRVITTRTVDGARLRTVIGVFGSAVEGAYAYALHIGPR